MQTVHITPTDPAVSVLKHVQFFSLKRRNVLLLVGVQINYTGFFAKKFKIARTEIDSRKQFETEIVVF